MKIAILTLPLNTNYGGILQAYALQTVLQGMGHKVTILNRRRGCPSFFDFILRLLSIIKCIYRIYVRGRREYTICSPLAENYHVIKENVDYTDINDFIDKYLCLSQSINSSSSVRRFVKKERFDCIIVGSDQVWREVYAPCIFNYFLNFLSKSSCVKKISYAASFGTIDAPIPLKKMNKCISLAQRFDAISVREQSAVKIIKDTFKLDALHVLDPTLLLSPEQYSSIIHKEDMEKSGLVSYILDADENKRLIIENVGEILGRNNTELLLKQTDIMGNTGKSFSISRWLASFINADFVVTDSFHGCVFSIIFKKQFIAIANRTRGIDRFYSLLNTFGLYDRLIFSKEDFDKTKELLLTPIDYNLVNRKYEQLKVESFEFLQTHMKS